MTGETNAPTHSNGGTPQRPAEARLRAQVQARQTTDAVTFESPGSVDLSKCSVKDSARLLGANCPKPRLMAVAAWLD
jgi:hypothetical protein